MKAGVLSGGCVYAQNHSAVWRPGRGCINECVYFLYAMRRTWLEGSNAGNSPLPYTAIPKNSVDAPAIDGNRANWQGLPGLVQTEVSMLPASCDNKDTEKI